MTLTTILSFSLLSTLSISVFAKEMDPCDIIKPVVKQTAYGLVTFHLCEKSHPEPPLLPYALKAQIVCKNGKKKTKTYNICDTNLETKELGSILSIKYYIGDFKKMQKAQGEKIICNEKNTLTYKWNLKKACS